MNVSEMNMAQQRHTDETDHVFITERETEGGEGHVAECHRLRNKRKRVVKHEAHDALIPEQ